MKTDKSIQAFFALLRAGLWENCPVHGEGLMVNGSSDVDWEKINKLAEEQSVVGLALAGIDWFKAHDSWTSQAAKSSVRFTVPQEVLLQMIGEVQIIEQQNKAMNDFVAKLIEKLRKEDVYAILVKGQGIAQCYERPLWRSSGDIDLLLSDGEYEKAKKVLLPIALEVEQEYKSFKHVGMTMEGGYVVELHGTMHSRLSKSIDRGVDEAQNDVFYGGNVRSWQNGNTQVFLPRADEDVIFVFTHILHHFYIEGIGLRQICDWCRLLWTYRSKLDLRLLESRIRKMGLMTEWKAYASLAVDFLGMPADAMPFYEHSIIQKRKAGRILSFVMETGNFGHNRDRSFYFNKPFLVRKAISFWRNTCDSIKFISIFPMDTIRIWVKMFKGGLIAALRCRG